MTDVEQSVRLTNPDCGAVLIELPMPPLDLGALVAFLAGLGFELDRTHTHNRHEEPEMGLRDTLREVTREATGADEREAEQARVANLPRWQYHAERVPPNFAVEALFDRLGGDGWELVAIVGERAVFKRPAA